MEEKKNQAPQREGGHKNNRRDGGRFNRQGGERREENGQRISVRPGNFNPPPRKGESAPAAPVAEAKPPKANGNEANENRQGSNRNRNRHNRRGRGGQRPAPEVQQSKPVSEARVQAPENKQKPAQREERRNDQRNRGRNDRRQGKRPEEQAKAAAEVLSPSMQSALDAEFSTPTISSTTSFFHKDPKKEEIAVDSEQFAIDIASAGYLLDDVPCGFPIPDGNAVEVVGVRFRHAGKMYFFAPGDLKLRIGEEVLVDTARGDEIGEIVMMKRRIAEKDVVQPLRAVLRVATEADKAHEQENRAKECEALKICAKKIAEHKLEMQLVDAQYTFDNSKLLFYFTSEGRVDFRELVRDLAGVFHTRIELRQIGIRDESRLIGGLGMCGRPFCCSTFLSDFGQVSIKMAKEQGLSINASKISGCCGRLMCCLRYEHETYAAESRLTPKKDTAVQTPDGPGVVTEATPLAGTVKVRLDNAPEEAPRLYHRDLVSVIGRERSAAKEKEPAAKTPEPQEN